MKIIREAYKDRLLKNFWALSNFNKIIYLILIRPFEPKKERIFFDGSFFLPGQMYKAERKGLYEAVVNARPDYCFEIGTFTGGGSTFFITEALKDNNKGKLFTTENNKTLYKKAKRRYATFIRRNFPFVNFIYSSTPNPFEKYLTEKDKSNFIFLDGAEDGKQTLEQYNYFTPYFKNGTVIALHDWNTEKTVKVKPVILQNPRWKKLVELNQPESVGFVIFKYT